MPSTSHGCHGRYLRVDLTRREWCAVPIAGEVLRRFVGGVGLGTWLLLEESPAGVDPLSAEAAVAFVFSPLVGSPLTTSAKFAVVAKSPLTERINDSLSSSHFAIAGKKTGYDAIVLVGQCEGPTCVVVEPEGVRFESAADLAGRSVPETERAVKERLGGGYRTAVIGPAGEGGVRYATVSHDGRHAGRGGHGAVLGSKNVKAVAVRGDRTVSYADAEGLLRYARELSRKSFGPATAKYRELGTVANLLVFNRLGTLPTRNFQAGSFAGAEALAPETLQAAREKARESCAACTIGCEHVYRRPGKTDGDGGVRMEYENLFALGPLCGVSDPDVVLEASALCDELGLDTISAGGTIAFAMECAERGLIDAPGLRFGDGAALLEAVRAIGTRSGLGDLLAEGSRRAAMEIGGGSEEFAPHVKGLELPGYEPRALQTMALGLAVGTRGADHNRSGAYQVDFSEGVERGKVGEAEVRRAIGVEDEAAVMDSLILCKFLRGVFEEKLSSMAEMLRLVTGWALDADELRTTARRIVTAKKLYNVREGWQPAEDTLPRRMLTTALEDGTDDGVALTEERLRTLVRLYNEQRGWTAEGWIPEATAGELGLGAYLVAEGV